MRGQLRMRTRHLLCIADFALALHMRNVTILVKSGKNIYGVATSGLQNKVTSASMPAI